MYCQPFAIKKTKELWLWHYWFFQCQVIKETRTDGAVDRWIELYLFVELSLMFYVKTNTICFRFSLLYVNKYKIHIDIKVLGESGSQYLSSSAVRYVYIKLKCSIFSFDRRVGSSRQSRYFDHSLFTSDLHTRSLTYYYFDLYVSHFLTTHLTKKKWKVPVEKT